jgi:hypothetical protein
VARESVSQILSVYPLVSFKFFRVDRQELWVQIPPKRDLEWMAGELNAILDNNLTLSHGGRIEHNYLLRSVLSPFVRGSPSLLLLLQRRPLFPLQKL